MKKIMQTALIAVITFCSVSFASAQQSSDNQLVGIATGAAHDCLQIYRGNFYELSSTVETTGICFVEGFLKEVTFYAGPNCIGSLPCLRFPTVPVARVTLDCNNNVISVSCLK